MWFDCVSLCQVCSRYFSSFLLMCVYVWACIDILSHSFLIWIQSFIAFFFWFYKSICLFIFNSILLRSFFFSIHQFTCSMHSIYKEKKTLCSIRPIDFLVRLQRLFNITWNLLVILTFLDLKSFRIELHQENAFFFQNII